MTIQDNLPPLTAQAGAFNPGGEAYTIHTPYPPRPWINYLTNGRYASLISQVAGGFSFHLDHRFNAVLERGIHQGTEDVPGRFIYLKDEESGEIWNANVHPIGRFDTFSATHRAGETQINSSYKGIQARLRFRVPPDLDGELWEIELEGESAVPRNLSVYACAAFSLGQQTLFEGETPFHSLFNRTQRRGKGFVATHSFWPANRSWAKGIAGWPWQVCMSATRRPDALNLDRAAWLGPQGDMRRPQGCESDLMPGGEGDGKLLCGVFQWRATLAPGTKWCTGVGLAVAPRDEDPAPLLATLEDPVTYRSSRETTQSYWRDLFDGVTVQTPDERINRMVNHWNKLQLTVNFHYGRGPSYYHKGQYPGLRDSSQDTFGMTPLAPERARENLVRMAGFFDSHGQPPGGCNRIGLTEKMSDKVDSPAWYALAIGDYIKQTGDWSLLDQRVSLADGGEETLFFIIRKAMERLLDKTGPHDLCLIGHGDWNDAADAIGPAGRGESVWLSQFVCFAVEQLKPLLERKNTPEEVEQYLEKVVRLRAALQAHTWAGDWFIRAFRDDGRPVGDGSEAEGKLWLNSQTWAVIAGTDTRERLERALDACEEYLATPWGLNKLWPAYTESDSSIGLITAFPPGWKENGAVFSHANAFHIVARAMLGRGRDAVRLFTQLLPDGRPTETYQAEPYVYSQFCAGTDSGEDSGVGAFHWLSGTAAWMFRGFMDYIMGVRAEYEGLRIDPAVDPSWKQFSITRNFRGSTYHVTVNNPDGVEHGVQRILLDGEEVAGTILPLPTRLQHTVEVWMGVGGANT